MIYNITDFGARADAGLCTKEVQAAIDACYLAGGGEVTVPAGKFTVAGLRLRSGVALHLLCDAELIGSRNPEDYFFYLDDKIEPISKEEREHIAPTVLESSARSVKPYSRWNNAIIRAIRAKDIAIIGEAGSRIDGRDCYDALGEEDYRGPHPINMWYCENIELSGYTVAHGGNWGHAIQNSKNITVRGVTVLGGHDGFDVRTCDNILVEDCVFETGDDCIAGFDNIGVTVRRCVLNSACSLFRFGGTDVLIEDCRGTAPSKYGFRKDLSDEKKRASMPTDETCRHSCHTVFLYYCDKRAKIRRTPGNILVRNSHFEGIDAIFNLPFGHKWSCNVSLADIKFENCDFLSLNLPLNISAPEGEPISLSLVDCNVSYSDSYGDEPFIRTKGHGKIFLSGVKIMSDKPYIESTDGLGIEIVNSDEIEIKCK